MNHYNSAAFNNGYGMYPCEEKIDECNAVCAPQVQLQPAVVVANKFGGNNCERIAQFFLWFIVLIVIFWLIFYSVRFQFCCRERDVDDFKVDTRKVLCAAVVAALIIILIVWVISCIRC